MQSPKIAKLISLDRKDLSCVFHGEGKVMHVQFVKIVTPVQISINGIDMTLDDTKYRVTSLIWDGKREDLTTLGTLIDELERKITPFL